MASNLLLLFIVLRLAQYAFETGLSWLNRFYYLNAERRAEAQRKLGITSEDAAKTLLYTDDKFRFGMISGAIELGLTLTFLYFGGLGVVESLALHAEPTFGQTGVGLVFFLILGGLSFTLSLPFDFYRVFVIEEKHGFNRQSPALFFLDKLKSVVLVVVLGGILLTAILWIMGSAGRLWWVWAWLAISLFSVLTAWIYPTFLAPLFNKFSPLPDGELKDSILALAKKVEFDTSGLFVMDASTRSAHGNAYFTGLFGKKRIVLFDTLLESMNPQEVVAVLAHELGHFKLHHVRSSLIRGILMTGLTFYLMSLALPMAVFYESMGLAGVSNYGALTVFSLWFGLVSFLTQPLETAISRRNEFAADRFSIDSTKSPKDLGSALLKLREKSHAMPIAHPIYSAFYYSHPPMLERLRAMEHG